MTPLENLSTLALALGPGINGELQIFQDGSYTVAVVGNYDHPNALAVADEIAAFLAAQAR